MKQVPLDLVLYLLENIPEELGFKNEPMFVLSDRAIKSLEHLLDLPFTEYDGVPRYPSLVEKAAALFYYTIKGHKFENGNKRTAVILVSALLYSNNKWVSLTPKDMYDWTVSVAESNPGNRAGTLKKLTEIFGEHIH